MQTISITARHLGLRAYSTAVHVSDVTSPDSLLTSRQITVILSVLRSAVFMAPHNVVWLKLNLDPLAQLF